MSAPVKRTAFTVLAAVLMVVLPSAFAITLARLMHRYEIEAGESED